MWDSSPIPCKGTVAHLCGEGGGVDETYSSELHTKTKFLGEGYISGLVYLGIYLIT